MVVKELHSEFTKVYLECSDDKLIEVFRQYDTEGELWESMGLRIDLICSFIDLFSQASTYGDDWFKTTFVEMGIFSWSLDFMYDLKLIIDRLE